MSCIAYLRDEADTRLETGQVVLMQNDNEYTVDVESTPYQAERAYGCLVRPEPGDIVLVLLAKTVYILDVLKRPREQEAVQEVVFRGPAA